MEKSANIVDLHRRRIFFGKVTVDGSRIMRIEELGDQREGDPFIMPGFVDAHVHIESSMLVPSEFARLAVIHGTVATVSDPHEIANVLGIPGVEYMLENAAKVPFHFFFGAPSCVPATAFETAGAEIDAAGIRYLLQKDEILYLAEMMNFPGVLSKDAEVLKKIAVAKEFGKPIDGHAPGLAGEDAKKYIDVGISTDHECVGFHEALWKLENGMKIIVREGSAARNFDALIDLIDQYPGRLMFCSDDKHPDELIHGHINQLAARAVAKGKDIFDVLRAACLNPVDHYRLSVGQLREGDPADFILVRDLKDFKVLETCIGGRLVAKEGKTLINAVEIRVENQFQAENVSHLDFQVKAAGNPVRVIRAIDGSLLTESMEASLPVNEGNYQLELNNDLLKIAVINRYQTSVPAVAIIHGFGLKKGAIASCVAHDSHNIVVVGTDDRLMAAAANAVIQNKGGISAVTEEEERVLPLPVAGIMSDGDGFKVAEEYAEIDAFVKKEMGSVLRAPFMTLSFMALLVIPRLKLSDKGLFDGRDFRFVPLQAG